LIVAARNLRQAIHLIARLLDGHRESQGTETVSPEVASVLT
jgi:hypothetical protein